MGRRLKPYPATRGQVWKLGCGNAGNLLIVRAEGELAFVWSFLAARQLVVAHPQPVFHLGDRPA